ncbi:MAG: hypothetical protein ACQEQ7_02755 [Thermodesulfobacteriota bacterium]
MPTEVSERIFEPYFTTKALAAPAQRNQQRKKTEAEQTIPLEEDDFKDF